MASSTADPPSPLSSAASCHGSSRPRPWSTTTVVVLVPLGRSQFAGGLWLWTIALVGLLGLNLYWPAATTTGGFVKWTTLAGGFAFLAVFPVGRSDSTLLDLGLFAVFGIVCIGTNLVHGFAGKITLAQAAFLGIGAYVSVLLDTGREITVGGITTTLPNLPFLVAVAIGAVFCMVVSVLVGFPALRVQGPWLAFVTLAFNLLVFLVLNNEIGLTGGFAGYPHPAYRPHDLRHRLLRQPQLLLLVPRLPAHRHRAGVVDRAQPVGTCLQGVARQPGPRRQPGRRHPQLHAAGVLDRRRPRRDGRRAVRPADRVRRSAGLLHRAVIRLLPGHRRRWPGHARRTVHRRFVHHRAHRSATRRRRLLPGVVRPVRDGDDGRRPAGCRRDVQPTPRRRGGPGARHGARRRSGNDDRRGRRGGGRGRHRRPGAQHHQVVRRHPGGRRRLVRGSAR